MSKGRIIFVGVVAFLALFAIFFSMYNKGYEKVGRVNEYVVYYNPQSESTEKYETYILKYGFFEITVKEAYETEEISDQYYQEIIQLIEEWENLNEESD